VDANGQLTYCYARMICGLAELYVANDCTSLCLTQQI